MTRITRTYPRDVNMGTRRSIMKPKERDAKTGNPEYEVAEEVHANEEERYEPEGLEYEGEEVRARGARI
jgi:hypothetical protein